jgi:hypothetical protein
VAKIEDLCQVYTFIFPFAKADASIAASIVPRFSLGKTAM